ncbi:ArsA-related P-loop ATPase [Streptomyces sp. NPDC048845]|uniref:ArsA family ATPase n=1 Tax=Streptomyces sp. NPDC048845 TaxID=3155390 RepID=UPI00343B2B56
MSAVVRTVLVTGPGGSGRTTAAAATALTAAREGRRTLFLTADRTGAPEVVLGVALPSRPAGPPRDPGPASAGAGAAEAPWTPPVRVERNLRAARADSGERLRDAFLGLQQRASSGLDLLGAAPLDREELTPFPGAAELALLRTLSALYTLPAASAAATGSGSGSETVTGPDGDWDLVVLDLPPAQEALALLALPEQLLRYLDRLLPPERQAARALRPLLAQLAGVPMPARWLYETADRARSELAAAQAVVGAESTTLRLVAEPGPAGRAALRRIRPAVALYGHRVDAVLAGRTLPTGSADPWLGAASGEQQAALKALREEWSGTAPLYELPHLGRAPRGTADLAALGAPPVAAPAGSRPGPAVADRREADGTLVWHIPLPAAERGEVDLIRRGDELVVAVGPFRRILPLPSALRRCTVSGAALADGELRVRFTPDPALWPRTS